MDDGDALAEALGAAELRRVLQGLMGRGAAVLVCATSRSRFSWIPEAMVLRRGRLQTPGDAAEAEADDAAVAAAAGASDAGSISPH